MNAKKTIIVFAALLLAAATVQAEVVPGRWELVDRLGSDTPIIIEFKAGERMECMYIGSSPETITYVDDTGIERTTPKKDIHKIEFAKKTGDSLKNGAGYGAVLGAAGAILALTAYAKSVTASGPIIDRESAGIFILAGLTGAGIGALSGAAIDASIKGRKVLYKAR